MNADEAQRALWSVKLPEGVDASLSPSIFPHRGAWAVVVRSAKDAIGDWVEDYPEAIIRKTRFLLKNLRT